MPGNPLVRFEEGRVGRTARCRPLSYSTQLSRFVVGQPILAAAGFQPAPEAPKTLARREKAA
jgi:hypothetical protein